jgi:hypothetical protein
MLNNIKVRLFKYSEMSLSALTQFKAWINRNEFDLESFGASSLRVATAKNASNRAICHVPIETVFLVSSSAVNPKTTEVEARVAGDIIDSYIEREGQQAGIRKCLIVVPPCQPSFPEERWIRVIERSIPQTINTVGLGSDKARSTVKFIS